MVLGRRLSSGAVVGPFGVRLRDGVFSSRKLERATYDSVAFRFITANEHPDHDTIATFRQRFLKDIEGQFVRVLELAREMGVLKLGTVALGRSGLAVAIPPGAFRART